MRATKRLVLGVSLCASSVAANARADDTTIVCTRPPEDVPGAPLGAAPIAHGGNIMAAQFDGGHGFYPVRSAPSGPPGSLVLTLSAPPTARANEALVLRVSLRNTSPHAATVLHPMDGSLSFMRPPSLELYLRDERSAITYRWGFRGSRCGMVNPVTPADYVRLAPGEARPLSTDWLNWAEVHAPPPGRYTLWAVYRLCSAGAAATQPPVDLGEYVSPPVSLTVR